MTSVAAPSDIHKMREKLYYLPATKSLRTDPSKSLVICHPGLTDGMLIPRSDCWGGQTSQETKASKDSVMARHHALVPLANSVPWLPPNHVDITTEPK